MSREAIPCGDRRNGPCGRVRRRLLAALGVACVGLGAIGIVVPGLPTTVFLLVASYLFARSSPSLERRLLRHPRLGAYLAQARGRTMPLRAKVVSVAGMWVGIGTSLFATGHVSTVLSVIVIGLGLVGTCAITFSTRTARGGAIRV
jgi:uncharacterized membrane protein YbaN (DUF454 family)